MSKVKDGQSKVKAYFSIDTKNFTINNVKLIQGDNGGLFAAMPSREYVNKKGEKKYQPIIWIKDLDYINAITEEAVKVYQGQPPDNVDEMPF